jgi:hypothetical protein
VILLGPVKRRRWGDFGVNRAGEAFRLLEGSLRRLGEPLLLLVVIEDRRPVLRADVAELPVLHRGVDVAPENVEESRIVDHGRVVGDLDRLGVTRLAR